MKVEGPLAYEPSLVPRLPPANGAGTSKRGLLRFYALGGLLAGALGASAFVYGALGLVPFGVMFAGLGIHYLVASEDGIEPLLEHSRSQCSLAVRGHFAELIDRQEQFLEASDTHRKRQMALHDLGFWELRAGHYRRSLAILSAFYSNVSEDETFDERIRQSGRENLAVAYALSGDLESASAWLREEDALPYSSARLVVAVRSGRYHSVVSLEYPEVTKQSAEILAHDKRVHALMRLFAQTMLHPEAQLSPDIVIAAEPQSRLEYFYLTRDWPELSAFVDEVYGYLAFPEPTIPKAALLPDNGAL